MTRTPSEGGNEQTGHGPSRRELFKGIGAALLLKACAPECPLLQPDLIKNLGHHSGGISEDGKANYTFTFDTSGWRVALETDARVKDCVDEHGPIVFYVMADVPILGQGRDLQIVNTEGKGAEITNDGHQLIPGQFPPDTDPAADITYWVEVRAGGQDGSLLLRSLPEFIPGSHSSTPTASLGQFFKRMIALVTGGSSGSTDVAA